MLTDDDLQSPATREAYFDPYLQKNMPQLFNIPLPMKKWYSRHKEGGGRRSQVGEASELLDSGYRALLSQIRGEKSEILEEADGDSQSSASSLLPQKEKGRSSLLKSA